MLKNYYLKIFTVEDDLFFANLLKHNIEEDGNYNVTNFRTSEEFFDNLHQLPDIVILDYNLPSESGLKILTKIQAFNQEIPIIMLSAQQDVEITVKAYNLGAKYYVIKNLHAFTEISLCIKNLSGYVYLKKEVAFLKSKLDNRSKYHHILGNHNGILNVLKYINQVEDKDTAILITGEVGTGKELVAEAIHENSSRREKPFEMINILEHPIESVDRELFGFEEKSYFGKKVRQIGLFEKSNGGTIVIKEIDSLSVSTQIKLLEAINNHQITRIGGRAKVPVKPNIIAIASKDLDHLVNLGKFNEKLFYRLQRFKIELPALRDRGEDMIMLAKKFLEDFCKIHGLENKKFSKSTLIEMARYHWSGNVSELKSYVENIALLTEGKLIKEEHLVAYPGVKIINV